MQFELKFPMTAARDHGIHLDPGDSEWTHVSVDWNELADVSLILAEW